MEYCDGGDLDSEIIILICNYFAELLKKINHFSESDALLHFKEILNGFKVINPKFQYNKGIT